MTAAALPPGLRDRVLAASRTARTAGRAAPAAPAIPAAEAFLRATDALSGVLSTLTVEQWRAPVLRDLDVQGLVGHLTAVERDVQRALAGDPEVADVDHVAATQDEALAQAGRSPGDTRAAWRAAAARTLEVVSAAPPASGQLLSMHGMRLTPDALLVVRAFELWTHENDIRTAAGLPRSVPDPSTLSLMTDLAVRLLPHALARAGAARATALHLVLTGAGGGTWDLPFGQREETAAPDDLLLVVDAVAFCRLVANRVRPGDLDAHVVGPSADHVLAAAATLALD